MSQNMEVASKEIGGCTYSMYMLPPMQSDELLMDVVQMVLPAVGPILDGIFSAKGSEEDSNIMQKELPAGIFAAAAKELSVGMNKKVRHAMIAAFKARTEVDGKPLSSIFDVHFMGKLEVMYQWLLWGMQVQWGKSLSVLVSEMISKGAGLVPKTGSPSPSI